MAEREPESEPSVSTPPHSPHHRQHDHHHRRKLDITSIRSIVSSINLHIHQLLSDPSARKLLQQRCASKLAPSTRHPQAPHFSFSDHSVLSNLYWGVDNVGSAADADASSPLLLSHLAAAESMLQVPALLDEDGTTAGVDNRFLVCCSYFYLALVRKLQGDDWQVAMHFLHALLVSPRYVRTEFAPGLCGGLWAWNLGEEEEIDEVMRRQARKYKDWLMYYQVASFGETPRWIEGTSLRACGGFGLDGRDRRKLQSSLYRKFEDAKDSRSVEWESAWPVPEDVVSHPQLFLDNKDQETVDRDKPSIAKLLELPNLDDLEEEASFRRFDEVYYQDKNGSFDIKRLQEILEDSQSDTTDSCCSQIDSTEESDSEVMMQDKSGNIMAISANPDFSLHSLCKRNSGKVLPSIHECIEINTTEVPRYSMHIEACSFQTNHLFTGKSHSSVSDINLSILGIRDMRLYPSYKCYMEYTTPPGRSSAHELRCIGHFPAKLLREYSFSELVPAGRKLNFLSIEKDWSEMNSDYENSRCVEFMGRLENALSSLCFSEGLDRYKDTGSEVMTIWKMLNDKSDEKYCRLKQHIIYQLLDIVSTFKEVKLVRASVLILLLLISEDKSVLKDIKKRASHLHGLARALQVNVREAAILIYMLKPTPSEIEELGILQILVETACNSNSHNSISLPLSPTAASISIIEILVTSFDNMTNNVHLITISSPQILTKLVNIARNKNLEEGVALVGILVRCMRLNGDCRKFLSKVTPVVPLIHLLKRNNNQAKLAVLEYFHEILRMPRSSAIALLHQIRQRGGINILYTLMVCTQQAQKEHKLLAANLLLQLDMLEDSCGKSVFKEEALEVLVESISCEDNSSLRTLSAFILSNIGGTYAWTGEPYTAAWLVKKAGLASLYDRNMVRNIDWRDPCLQEPEIDTWNSKIAKGLIKMGTPIFDALAKGLESNIKSISRGSLVAIAWLGYEVVIMHPNDLRYTVCEILLGGILRFLHPGSDLDERVIACFCIYNFASGKGMQKLMNFSEGVRESLRRLSNVTWMADELLKVTDCFIPTKPRVSCVHTQILEAGKVGSGAATALVFYKGHLYGGYADGSIKVWDIKGQTAKLVYEVKEHKKPVTCFTLFEPGDSLLSGSIDKTLKVWQILQKKLECLETIEMKEPVHKLSTHGDRIFVVTQGRGLKLYRASMNTETICKSKTVKCLAVTRGKVYVGCADSSIQGFDIMDNRDREIKTPSNIWRLQNKAISSIYVYKYWLYSAGANVEELDIKDWRRRNKPKISIALEKGISVQEMVVVEDFIYLNCSSSPSILQIWLRGKQQKVGRVSAGSKITSLLTVNDIILCGTETGLIKGWIPL